MISAVWMKIVRDMRWQLIVSCLLLFLFGWLFVWLNSLLKLGVWTTFLEMLPDFVHKLMPVSPKQLITLTGRVSLIFVHIVPLIICLGWAMVRGSETVGGEIESGRFEVLLTLPLPRWVWVIFCGMATLGGAVLMGAGLCLGIEVARSTVRLPQPLDTSRFFLAALNLVFMTFAVAGMTSFFSACFRSRTGAMCVSGIVFVISLVVKLVAQLWPAGRGLRYLSFLVLFEPQAIIFSHDGNNVAVVYNLGLVMIGVVGYLLAAILLLRRDIPVAR